MKGIIGRIRASLMRVLSWMLSRIDWALNRGPIWIIGWLALAVFTVAFSSAVIVSLFHLTQDGSFPHVMWTTLIRTIDPGQIAEDKGGFAFLALGITLVGLLLFSSLISLTSSQFERRVEHVRRGRDPVRLKGQNKDESLRPPYYVVLGWTDLTRKVVEELLFSGSGKQVPTVAVMSDTPWTEMDAVMHEWWRGVRSSNKADDGDPSESWRSRRQSPVQLRTGNPCDKRDLEKILKIEFATSVVVLSKDHISSANGKEFTASQILAQLQEQKEKAVRTFPHSVFAAQVADPDTHDGSHDTSAEEMESETAETVKCILAVVAAIEKSHPVRGVAQPGNQGFRRPRVIAEFPRASGEHINLGSLLAERLKAVGVELVTAEAADLQAHIAAQVAFSPGLSVVFRDLVNFGGSELYLRECQGDLAGMTFADAKASCTEARVVGLYSSEGSLPDGKRVLFCPSADTLVAGHQLVLLAEDGHCAEQWTPAKGQSAGQSQSPRSGGLDADQIVTTHIESVLVLGWNHRAAELLISVRHMHPNAELTVVLPHWVTGQEDLLASYQDSHLKFEFAHHGIQPWVEEYYSTPATSRNRYNRVLLLADDTVKAEVADAEVLLSALAFRPSTKALNPNSSVVEFRQRSSRYLTTGGVVDDHIIADSLLANLLAQFAVEPRMKEVLNTLLEVGGGQVELHPYEPAGELTEGDASELVDPEGLLSLLMGVTDPLYLGFRMKPESGVGLGEVALNPPTGSKAPRVKHGEISDLIVLVPDRD